MVNILLRTPYDRLNSSLSSTQTPDLVCCCHHLPKCTLKLTFAVQCMCVLVLCEYIDWRILAILYFFTGIVCVICEFGNVHLLKLVQLSLSYTNKTKVFSCNGCCSLLSSSFCCIARCGWMCMGEWLESFLHCKWIYPGNH